jgi:hypothetical protein
MAATAAYVVGQKRFVSTMRKAGADMKELKEVNRQAANIALPAVRNLAPRGKNGRLASSIRVGATQKAGVIRAGSKSVPYAASSTTGGQPGASSRACSSTTAWPRRKARGSASTGNSSIRHSTK